MGHGFCEGDEGQASPLHRLLTWEEDQKMRRNLSGHRLQAPDTAGVPHQTLFKERKSQSGTGDELVMTLLDLYWTELLPPQRTPVCWVKPRGLGFPIPGGSLKVVFPDPCAQD